MVVNVGGVAPPTDLGLAAVSATGKPSRRAHTAHSLVAAIGLFCSGFGRAVIVRGTSVDYRLLVPTCIQSGDGVTATMEAEQTNATVDAMKVETTMDAMDAMESMRR
jgi:hypothetical protein